MSVALAEWSGLLEREYLAEFIPAGGAAVKIAVAPPEYSAVTLQAIETAAQRHGCATARVQATAIRVQMIEKLFFAVARQIDWDGLATAWLRERFVENGYQVAPGQALDGLEALAAQRGLRAVDVRAEAERWIINGLLREYRLTREFRTAMAMLCRAQINPQNISPSDADVIKAWLHGERPNLTALKRVQIFGRIARHNARLHLGSLALWLHMAGQAGLCLLLDAGAVTQDIAPGTPDVVRYTRNATLDFYEVLRQFIDDTDELEYFLLAVVAEPGMIEHPKKNVDNYTALKLRTSDEVRDRHRSNPLNALVKLSAAA